MTSPSLKFGVKKETWSSDSNDYIGRPELGVPTRTSHLNDYIGRRDTELTRNDAGWSVLWPWQDQRNLLKN